MVKVLLVVEDYGELVYFQTLLKKIGFDVEGANSKHKINDIVLGFKPQVTIVSARGRKMDAAKVIEELASKNLGIQFIYIQLAPKMAINKLVARKIIQYVLEAPVSVFDLVNAVADLSGIDGVELEKKLHKLAQSGDANVPPEMVHITSEKSQKATPDKERSVLSADFHQDQKSEDENMFSSKKPPMTKDDRRRRFDRALAQMSKEPPPPTAISGDRVREFNRKIRSQDDLMDENGEFITQHRQFIKTLLKTKK